MLVAARGVCIGVGRNLAQGDPVPSDLAAAEVAFLKSIGAVVEAPDVEPAKDAAPPPVAAKRSKKGDAPAAEGGETQEP